MDAPLCILKCRVCVFSMYITPDLSFLNIYNPFTNERISVYLDKHNRMSLNTKDYFIKQISHLLKGVVIVVSVECQANSLCNVETFACFK